MLFQLITVFYPLLSADTYYFLSNSDYLSITIKYINKIFLTFCSGNAQVAISISLVFYVIFLLFTITFYLKKELLKS